MKMPIQKKPGNGATAKAGELAKDSCTLVCVNCNCQVRVEKANAIPKCPQCGHSQYGERFL
jgi:hypothetical protein